MQQQIKIVRTLSELQELVDYFQDKDLFRFWAKVHKSEGCWNWTASRDTSGYGLFRLGRKLYKAHRFSWIIALGSIPTDLVVCHKCDNPICVNPIHLFLGTRADNNLDRDRKNRQVSVKGEEHYRAVLTISDVMKMRYIKQQNPSIPYYTIAAQFNVCASTAHRAITRKSWK